MVYTDLAIVTIVFQAVIVTAASSKLLYGIVVNSSFPTYLHNSEKVFLTKTQKRLIHQSIPHQNFVL